MAKYKVGDEVVFKAKITHVDRNDDGIPVYNVIHTDGYGDWARESQILGLAGDLLPKREPQVGEWVDFTYADIKGIGVVESVNEFGYAIQTWSTSYGVPKGHATVRETPGLEEILAMVKGK